MLYCRNVPSFGYTIVPSACSHRACCLFASKSSVSHGARNGMLTTSTCGIAPARLHMSAYCAVMSS